MIEWIWGKKRILDMYLNVIEMGPGIFGVEAAAQKYFNKSADKLTRREAAMIAACLPNPKIYSVKPVSPYVAGRTGFILRQMRNLEEDPDVQNIIKE
jgi:monofunctional biosynthetic peptidoglycan transglycosylase